MKTKISTLALALVFGLGLTNAQEVKKVKKETKKEATSVAAKTDSVAKSTKDPIKKETHATHSEAKPVGEKKILGN